MHRLLNILFTTLLVAQTTTAQSDYQPCGLKTAPCPVDQTCISDSDSCTDTNRCLGHCKWTNQYEDCGGFRAVPKYCDETSECVDDPREPDSCGMACDAPGICVPKDTGASCCGEGRECPEGTWCYDMEKVELDGTSYMTTICL